MASLQQLSAYFVSDTGPELRCILLNKADLVPLAQKFLFDTENANDTLSRIWGYLIGASGLICGTGEVLS